MSQLEVCSERLDEANRQIALQNGRIAQLTAQLVRYAALEEAVAALAAVDGAIKHAAATLDIGALDGMAEREHAAVKTILARYEVLRATAADESRPDDADNQLQPWPGPGYVHTAGGPGGHWEPVSG